MTDEDVTLQRGEGEGQEKDGQDKDTDQGEEQDKAGGCFLWFHLIYSCCMFKNSYCDI